MLEIDRDTAVYDGLYLADSPLRLAGVADQIAGNKFLKNQAVCPWFFPA